MSSDDLSTLYESSEWQIILKRPDTQQIVLYNEASEKVVLENLDQLSLDVMNAESQLYCSQCKRPFDYGWPQRDGTADKRYFEFLGNWMKRKEKSASVEGQWCSKNLSETSFNQGYYQNFFKEGRKLGRGGGGSVFLCQHQIDSVSLGEYAVKKVPIGDDREWLQNMLREVHILERIRHPNIIDYKHTWIEYYRPTRFGPTIPTLFVLMEYANGGNLEDFVLSEIVETSDSPASGKRAKKTQPKPAAYLEEIEILTIFASIAKGLEHLHGLGIIHRDLKPANLLLHYDRDKVSDPTVLISDFGQSTEKTDSSRNAKRTGVTGTIEFMAPELLLTDPETSEFLHEHTQHSDIWSLGMVAYFMYFGHLPYSNVDDFDVLHNEILGLQSVKIPTTLRPISSLIARLLSDMLNVDPTERPLAKKIINVVAFVIGSIRSSPKLRQPPSQLPGHSLEGFPLLRLVGTSNKSIKPAKLILGYFLRRASTTSKTLTIINLEMLSIFSGMAYPTIDPAFHTHSRLAVKLKIQPFIDNFERHSSHFWYQ